jgi:hypothetical protein
MSEISREELIAFAEAHSKTAVALDKITAALENITDKQDKIIDKMTNGISDAIVDGVTDNYNSTHKETVAALARLESNQKDFRETITSKVPSIIDDKLSNSAMAKDIEHTKWFVATIGMVVIVATIILKFVGAPADQRMIEQQNQVIKHMLDDHEQKEK